MQDFIDYLNKGIIRNLKNYYKVGIESKNDKTIFNKVIENLSLLNRIDLNDDIFISLYAYSIR